MTPLAQHFSLQLVRDDPSLEPHAGTVEWRGERHRGLLGALEAEAGGLQAFASAYEDLGLHAIDGGGTRFADWAPAAEACSLVGDFNDWDTGANPCERGEDGLWRCVVPGGVPHGSRVRVAFRGHDGSEFTRIPAYARACCPAKDDQPYLDGLHWDPPSEERHAWQHAAPPKPAAARIYEAHVGMSSEAHAVASYRHFADDVLPRVKAGGFNTVQLMGVQEHALYSSFGYQVTSPFAPSHRCGTPEDLKYLIDTAHGMGLRVLLDVVHSHASSNVMDGLNMYDGTDSCYFHSEYTGRGTHALWTTRMYDYGRRETQRLLLSNLSYWLNEFRFDDFRFDGVTAMLYHHRGVHWDFIGGVSEYFGEHVDEDAVTYLMVANDLARTVNKDVTTICEDVSAMPGSTQPTRCGGLGFDLRLGMGPADEWFRLIQRPDEHIGMGDLVSMLTRRRPTEKTVAYIESHDQAMVGGMSFAQALMGEEIHHHMRTGTPETAGVHRGVALHKMTRLLTVAAGGDAFLNFMGNEFGHPGWIDFPREGNGQSFEHARRRWSLVDEDEDGRHAALGRFGAALMALDEERGILNAAHLDVLHCNEDAKVIILERGSLLFVFNFHPTLSHENYAVPFGAAGSWERVLDTDEQRFAGHGRVSGGVYAHSLGPFESHDRRPASAFMYLPARTAQVFSLLVADDVAGALAVESYSAGEYTDDEDAMWW